MIDSTIRDGTKMIKPLHNKSIIIILLVSVGLRQPVAVHAAHPLHVNGPILCHTVHLRALCLSYARVMIELCSFITALHRH